MAPEQIRLQWPLFVCSDESLRSPLLMILGPRLMGVPLFDSEDDGRLFATRNLKGERTLLKISGASELLAFLEGFRNVPAGWGFQVMMNPVELLGDEIRMDVAELISQLRTIA